MQSVQAVDFDKLLIDLRNPRIEQDVTTQREAIRAMATVLNDKLFYLSQDIVKFGLDPSVAFIVMPAKEKNPIHCPGRQSAFHSNKMPGKP